MLNLAQSISPPSVLIVEDEAYIRLEIADAVHGLGLRAHLAGTCAEAARLLNEGLTCCLAIIDLGLPDGSGAEVVWKFWASQPFTPVIVATAQTELPANLQQAKAAGQVVHLQKPWLHEDLIATIKRLVENLLPGRR